MSPLNKGSSLNEPNLDHQQARRTLEEELKLQRANYHDLEGFKAEIIQSTKEQILGEIMDKVSLSAFVKSLCSDEDDARTETHAKVHQQGLGHHHQPDHSLMRRNGENLLTKRPYTVPNSRPRRKYNGGRRQKINTPSSYNPPVVAPPLKDTGSYSSDNSKQTSTKVRSDDLYSSTQNIVTKTHMLLNKAMEDETGDDNSFSDPSKQKMGQYASTDGRPFPTEYYCFTSAQRQSGRKLWRKSLALIKQEHQLCSTAGKKITTATTSNTPNRADKIKYQDDLVVANLRGSLEDYNIIAAISGDEEGQHQNRQHHHAKTAHQWENLLAHNILQVYANKATSDATDDNAKKHDRAQTAPTVLNEKQSSIGEYKGEPISISPAVIVRRHTLSKVKVPMNPKMIWLHDKKPSRENWIIDLEKLDLPPEFVDTAIALFDELRVLEKSKKYLQYTSTLEFQIQTFQRQSNELDPVVVENLYIRLTTCSISFGMGLIDQGDFTKAMELLDRSRQYLNHIINSKKHSQQASLMALIHSAYSYYYIKRNKASAALEYSTKAKKVYLKSGATILYGKCLLQHAFIQAKLKRYDDSIQTMEEILSMLNTGKFDKQEDAAGKVLIGESLRIIAITYHNIACQKYILGKIEEACDSSRSARRIAKHCLAYSNKFVPQLEA